MKGALDLAPWGTCGYEHSGGVRLEVFGITVFELFKVHHCESMQAFLCDLRGWYLAGPVGSPAWSNCPSFPWVELQGVCAVVSSYPWRHANLLMVFKYLLVLDYLTGRSLLL